MDISKHVVNLELSRKLIELGVKTESLFIYKIFKDEHKLYFHKDRSYPYHWHPYIELLNESVNAYLSSELSELMGYWVTTRKTRVNEYWCRNHFMEYEHDTFAETECDARAKMLIYLIKNGLLKAEDLK